MCGHLMPNICQSFFHSVNFVIDFLPTYCVRISKDKTMIIIISVGTRAEKQRLNWEQTTFLQTIALNWKEGSKRRRWRRKTSRGGGSVASQGGWLHLEELWAAHAIAFLRCSPPIRSSQVPQPTCYWKWHSWQLGNLTTFCTTWPIRSSQVPQPTFLTGNLTRFRSCPTLVVAEWAACHHLTAVLPH